VCKKLDSAFTVGMWLIGAVAGVGYEVWGRLVACTRVMVWETAGGLNYWDFEGAGSVWQYEGSWLHHSSSDCMRRHAWRLA
jgi:hypothetical protein